jgi:hypothetical protein
VDSSCAAADRRATSIHNDRQKFCAQFGDTDMAMGMSNDTSEFHQWFFEEGA